MGPNLVESNLMQSMIVLRDFPLVHEVWLCFFQDALLNSA